MGFGELLILGWIVYVWVPALLPTAIGFRCSLQMPQVSTLEGVLVGAVAGVACFVVGYVWTSVLLSSYKFWLTFGPAVVVMLLSAPATILVCNFINERRTDPLISRIPKDNYRRDGLRLMVSIDVSLLVVGTYVLLARSS